MIQITKLKCGVELPMFLIFYSAFLADPISYNFVIYRTCHIVMLKDESECSKLGLDTSDNATRELEKEVQTLANYLNSIISVITFLLPCILCLFIGPYSDKKGRRRILIISSAGMALPAAFRILVALLPNLSPWYLAIQMIPTMLTGGLPVFVSVAFCYLVDVTERNDRSVRMGWGEGAFRLGMILGAFGSSYIFIWIGYVGTFTLSFVLLLLALGITVLLLPESIKINEDVDVKLFTFVHIKDICVTTFKPREGYNRMVVLGCFGAAVLVVICDASGAAETLLARSKFHWGLTELSNSASIRLILNILGMCAIIYVFQKLLKISECLLIVVGVTAGAIGCALIAFANYDWTIFAAAVIRMPVGLLPPMLRAIVSHIIPKDEIGKILSFSISIESLCTQVGAFLYTVVYTETMQIFPGAFNLIPVGIYIGIAIYFIFIYILSKRPNAIIYVDENGENEVKNSV